VEFVSMRNGPETLDRLFAEQALVVAPGVFDGFSARAVEISGFSAAYVTGAGSSLSHLGVPDLGLIGESDMVDQIFRLADATTLPLIVDGDTGFGGIANVVRTVRRYERAGAAAIQLEDQVFPKRCGHLDGKEVIGMDAFATRIAAACEARADERFKIIARTDAIQPYGLDAAIERANAYAAAGADLVFIEAPESIEHIERIAREVSAPRMINMISHSVTPTLSAEQLAHYGFKLAIYPIVTMASAMDGMLRALRALRDDGDDRSVAHLTSPRELFEYFGLDEWQAIAARDLPSEPGEALQALD
jgi:2-methylisocitrate lyase-like PEP mutase family enzyme